MNPEVENEKLNEEIMRREIDRWISGDMSFEEWKEGTKPETIEFCEICMNKARQQGADNMREKLHKEGVDLCCSDCDKVKEARQQGIESERKRIIEMIENELNKMEDNDWEGTYVKPYLEDILDKLKNSEANGK